MLKRACGTCNECQLGIICRYCVPVGDERPEAIANLRTYANANQIPESDVIEYVGECEHLEGLEYWMNFPNPDAAVIEDFNRYRQFAAE